MVDTQQHRNQAADSFKDLRLKMVREQLKPRGINDVEVLRAMSVVERHLFVPVESQPLAYFDGPLSIGYGQTISQPYIVAYMSQVLQIHPGIKVLEVGTGSGYQAAILAELGAEVYTLEIIEPLANKTEYLLLQLGYTTIHCKTGDGYLGWPEQAPFDRIIVTCAPTHIPQALIEQLAEGGRMVIPYGYGGVQRLDVFLKKDEKLQKISTLPVRFVPMINATGDAY